MKTYMGTVGLYESKLWTIGKEEMEKLLAWCYRRMRKISWRKKLLNDKGSGGRVWRDEKLLKTIKKKTNPTNWIHTLAQ